MVLNIEWFTVRNKKYIKQIEWLVALKKGNSNKRKLNSNIKFWKNLQKKVAFFFCCSDWDIKMALKIVNLRMIWRRSLNKTKLNMIEMINEFLNALLKLFSNV